MSHSRQDEQNGAVGRRGGGGKSCTALFCSPYLEWLHRGEAPKGLTAPPPLATPPAQGNTVPIHTQHRYLYRGCATPLATDATGAAPASLPTEWVSTVGLAPQQTLCLEWLRGGRASAATPKLCHWGSPCLSPPEGTTLVGFHSGAGPIASSAWSGGGEGGPCKA